MSTIQCVRCDTAGPRMAFQPFGNALGQRAFDEICATCWSQWLQHQQALINHYALNVQDPKAKEFLFASMERYLFQGDEGLPTA